MTREIKFRAWSKRPAVMCYEFANGTEEVNHGINKNLQRYIDDDNWVVMQFTGLKDKNGKDIWEGDIVRAGSGTIAEVYWNSELGCFLRWGWTSLLGEYDELEVIGDIHTTPNLLTNGDK